MASKVGSLKNVRLGESQYVFIIVYWDEYESPLRTQLDANAEAFGRDLRDSGMVVQGYDTAIYDIAGEVRDKNWPEELKEKIASDPDPLMIIIHSSFEDFDPTEDPWAILWFSQWAAEPESLHRLFRALAERARQDEDLFDYVMRVARKQKFRKWAQFFSVDAKVLGVGININAILQDATAT